MARGTVEPGRGDESLEILFWWAGGDTQHRIEDGLEEYLDDPPDPIPHRRMPWPGRRSATSRRRSTA
jgi:hypothetical protein